MTWKSAQHQRTGVLEIFRHDWVVALLERIRTTQTPQFSGVLSALYVADRLAAIHLGIRNVRALHIWFPAFERAYEKYSPGLILLVELAKAAASMGIERIDLGKGSERYKASFKSGTLPLAEGSVDIRLARKALRRHWYRAKQWIRSSPRAVYLKALLDSSRRLRQRMAFL